MSIPLSCVIKWMLLCLLVLPKWSYSQSGSKSSGLDSLSLETRPFSISHHYRLGSDTSKFWKREIHLPAKGRFVEESHYVTNKDHFPSGRLFANTLTEAIDSHLMRSYVLYSICDSIISYDSLYSYSWQKQWTPAERGQIGQGSVGIVQAQELTVWDEMWMMNMMWEAGYRPKRGSRFLMSFNGKSVVVIAGYETGPASEQYLGGCTTEVHAYLGTTNKSEISIEYLVDQEMSTGPLND